MAVSLYISYKKTSPKRGDRAGAMITQSLLATSQQVRFSSTLYFSSGFQILNRRYYIPRI
jgi:hypothetical protein